MPLLLDLLGRLPVRPGRRNNPLRALVIAHAQMAAAVRGAFKYALGPAQLDALYEDAVGTSGAGLVECSPDPGPEVLGG